MNIRLALNQESADALRELAATLPLAIENISDATEKLFSNMSHLNGGLGVHRDDFILMLQQIRAMVEKAREVIQILPAEMNHKADQIEVYLAKRPDTPCPLLPSQYALPKEMILSGLGMSRADVLARGERAIQQCIEAKMDDLHDRGITDPGTINAELNAARDESFRELYNDVCGDVRKKCIEVLNLHKPLLKKEHWVKLTPTQRRIVLNNMAIEVGKALRVNIEGCRFFDAGDHRERGNVKGNPNDRYIYLNEDVLDDIRDITGDPDFCRKSAMETILHEARHAFQRVAGWVDFPARYGVDAAEAYRWACNFRDYKDYRMHGRDEYLKQCIERDAREFAESILLEVEL